MRERDVNTRRTEPQNRKKGVTVERIKSVALNLFNEWGYRGTTVRDICDEIGITAPSMYYYFESKESIFVSLMDQAIQELGNTVEETIENSKANVAQDRMKELFEAVLQLYREEENKVIFLVKNRFFSEKGLESSVKSRLMEPGRKIGEHMLLFLTGSQKRRMPKTDPKEIIIAFDGFVTGYLMHLNQGMIQDTPEQAEKSWELFWKGIA